MLKYKVETNTDKLPTKTVLDAIFSTIKDTKTHGVSNIIKSEVLILKLIWILCFTTSVSYCLYQIIVTMIVFFSYNIVQNTLVVYECPAQFPALVICNLNSYDGNVAGDYFDSILHATNLSALNYNRTIDYVEDAYEMIKTSLDERSLKGEFDQFKNGFKLEKMLISCKFYGSDCDINDFYYIHDYDYGNCYKFNAGFTNKAGYSAERINTSIKYVNKPGSENGLRLELFTGNTKHQQKFSYKTGVRLVVHNQTRRPLISSDGIDVPAGLATSISISRTFIKHLPAPYSSNCVDLKYINWKSNDVLEFIMKYLNYRSYSRDYCMMACLQKYIIKTCNCFYLKNPLNNSTYFKSCTSLSEIKCLQDATHMFYESQEDIRCFSKCQLECTEVIYNLRLNQAKYPSEWYANQLLNNSRFLNMIIHNSGENGPKLNTPSLSSLSLNTLMINLYYDKMQYEYISESPAMSFDLMLACIGGHMGLFLGCSILVVVELFEILFHVVYIFMRKEYDKVKKILF